MRTVLTLNKMNILYATSLFTVYEICKAPNTDLLVAVRRRKSDAVWKQLLLFHNFSFKNKLITIDTVEERLVGNIFTVLQFYAKRSLKLSFTEIHRC